MRACGILPVLDSDFLFIEQMYYADYIVMRTAKYHIIAYKVHTYEIGLRAKGERKI